MCPQDSNAVGGLKRIKRSTPKIKQIQNALDEMFNTQLDKRFGFCIVLNCVRDT